MGIFDRLKSFIHLMVKNILSIKYASLDADILTPEEIDHLIKYNQLYLANHPPGKKDIRRGAAILGIAMSYYRRAVHHSDYHKDDINQAIHFAHQAEPYFKEPSLPGWEILQEILGYAYMIKADGSRSENYELAIPYLENCLKSSRAHRFPNYQSEIHATLMMAYSGSSKTRSKEKVEEHAALAVELHPDKQDKRWVEFVSQMKIISSIGLSRDVYQYSSPGDLNFLLPMLRSADVIGDSATDMGRILQMFFLKARMAEICESLIEEIASLPLAEEVRLRLSIDARGFNLMSLFSDHPDLLPAEKLETVKAFVDKLIDEHLEILSLVESAEARALGELAAADFFIHKFMLTLGADEREAILNRARFYFEKGWQWTVQFTPRSSSIRLMTSGRMFGTLLYFYQRRWVCNRRPPHNWQILQCCSRIAEFNADREVGRTWSCRMNAGVLLPFRRRSVVASATLMRTVWSGTARVPRQPSGASSK